MEGYELVTCDDCRVGRVVGTAEGLVLVEHGTLHKVRHAVPETLLEVDDAERVVRTTLSKQMVEESPKVKKGGDAAQWRGIAAYYGLASGFDHPETEGYGQLNADDPALSAELQAARSGRQTGAQERLEVRKKMTEREPYGSPGRQIIPPDAGKHK